MYKEYVQFEIAVIKQLNVTLKKPLATICFFKCDLLKTAINMWRKPQ